MTTLLFHAFPDRATLLARLTEVDPNPHAIANYYPLLADRLAGQEMAHLGVVTAFLLAQADYIDRSDLPGTTADVLAVNAPDLMEAVIDDPAFLSAVAGRWNEVAG